MKRINIYERIIIARQMCGHSEDANKVGGFLNVLEIPGMFLKSFIRTYNKNL
jgi:hypothetical protein